MNLIKFYIKILREFPIGQNTGYDYAIALILFFASLLVLKFIQMVILSRLKKLAEKTKTDFDNVMIKIFKEIKPPFYFYLAFYFGLKTLTLPQILNQVLYVIFIILIVYEVIKAIEKIIDFGVEKYINKTQQEEVDMEHARSMMKTGKVILKIVLWLLGITLILANLGVNVTSIIASLGIGGIAVALALQNVLGDIFSSFSIYMDKPFQVGDFIVIGADMGTVEKIGIKTTRIRSLLGEEIVISNKELTTTRVQNFKRMEKRRVLFNLGVVYDTSKDKLEKIPEIIKEIVAKQERAEFDRCHFKEYGDFSLNFEVVFYVLSADYNEYLDIRQAINLEIYKKFEEEQIEFAYPSQTIFVSK